MTRELAIQKIRDELGLLVDDPNYDYVQTAYDSNTDKGGYGNLQYLYTYRDVIRKIRGVHAPRGDFKNSRETISRDQVFRHYTTMISELDKEIVDETRLTRFTGASDFGTAKASRA